MAIRRDKKTPFRQLYSTTPSVARTEPGTPPSAEPIKVAILMAIGPGVDSDTAIIFSSSSSVVAYAVKIKFLGYGFYKSQNGYKLRVHKKSQVKMRKRVKELTSRKHVNDYDEWKRALKQVITGWVNYYKLADMGNLLKETDKWMRRRIRVVFWKKWKRIRTRYRNLRKLGISHANAIRLERAGFVSLSGYYKSVAV